MTMTNKDTEDDFSIWEIIILNCEWLALRWGWLPPTTFLGWWLCGFEDWRFWGLLLIGFVNNYGATRAGWCLAFAHMDDDGEEDEEEVFYDL